MEIIDKICSTLLTILGALVFYKTVLTVLGFITKSKKFKETDKKYKYAIVISARNEGKVIGNLLDSINNQTYDSSLITTFVVADNCTDDTYEVAKSKGAIVYERFNKEYISKGYALRYLFDKIECDYKISSFDAFLVFDADNLLNPTYMHEMNKAYANKAKLITSYRNTKNFDTNFISASYGIHFYRHSMIRHRPRTLLNLGTQLAGTGYLIDSSLLVDGWNYVSLTEDAEFTMSAISKKIKVDYCEAAEFFDEQPVDLATALKQRTRWEKGRFIEFTKHGYEVFKGIFKYRSFTCYDLFFSYFPYSLVTTILGLIYPTTIFLYNILSDTGYDLSVMLRNVGTYFLTLYLSALLSGVLTVIRERKNIHCKTYKLIFFLILWPWFDLIATPILIVSMFMKVKWKQIDHCDGRKIEDIIPRNKKSTA